MCASSFPFARLLCSLALVFCLLGARTACGHDPLASFADVWLGPQTMEVTITMARPAAFLLIKDQNPGVPYVDVDTFPKARELLLAQAANLCQWTADGAKMTPGSLEVELTDENDVRFRMVFPRPAAGGPLRFEAAYLHKMMDGHVLTYAVWRENKTNLSNQEMRADENPALEVKLPPVSASAAAPAATSPSPISSGGQP
jgi:hypothetical protein